MKNLKTQVNIENTSLNLDQNLPILFDKKSKTTISKQLNYIKVIRVKLDIIHLQLKSGIIVYIHTILII